MSPTYRQLYADIKSLDVALAPGSETSSWGDFCDDYRKRTGAMPWAHANDEASNAEAPPEFVAYWLEVYDDALLDALGEREA